MKHKDPHSIRLANRTTGRVVKVDLLHAEEDTQSADVVIANFVSRAHLGFQGNKR